MKGSNKVFGYIRVSTQKQGREGVSLEAQREAISRYANSRGLDIVEWIEDQESAAKQGRTGFGRMVGLLKRGKASGFICHKLDRSVRNIYDWSAIHQLVDSGFDIHFAQDGLDLHSLSGKLSADIQAAIAAHYSRNLRDEVRKGMVGRLKQGYLPFAAPVGYVDNGGGKEKTIDPLKGPLVRDLFELYATGLYGFDELRLEMFRRGLRSSTGKPLVRDRLTLILNNPFYYGLIKLKRTGETFMGNHRPLIAKRLFDRCQVVLHKRVRRQSLSHEFVFRRRIECAACGHHLIGERQKGLTYYRCHSSICPGTCLREEVLLEAIRADFRKFVSLAQFTQTLLARLAEGRGRARARAESAVRATSLEMGQIDAQLDRLLDLTIDGQIAAEQYAVKREALLNKRIEKVERMRNLNTEIESTSVSAQKFLELQESAQQIVFSANPVEIARIALPITSNFSVQGKKPCIRWVSPFQELTKFASDATGGRDRDQTRTFEELCRLLGV